MCDCGTRIKPVQRCGFEECPECGRIQPQQNQQGWQLPLIHEEAQLSLFPEEK